MKIAFFTDTYYPDINGVANTLKLFTDYLNLKGITFKVFAPVPKQAEVGHEYVSDQIHHFKSMSFFLYPECRVAFPNMFQLKAELESFAPDLIHIATPFNIGLCGVYFAKKLNIPLVGSYHTDFDYYLQFYDLQFLSKYLWKYMHWFHRPFRKVFVPSNVTYNQLNRHGFTNLEKWPHGVDCQLFHPSYDRKLVRSRLGIEKKYLLTYVGRLAPEKDLKTLMAVAKALPYDLNQHLQWLIIGDGPLRKDLEMEAASNMTFTGYLNGEALAEAYCASDLFVFPSPTETFGNVALEALASGTPVIGANAGGVKNIVKAGMTGILCEPGNVEDFTRGIVQLLTNKGLRTQMGHEARNYALTQKWDEIFDEMLDHYSAILKARPEQKIFA
ncbi:glycosyltransferase family 1 protein [Bacillus sp. DNRA2]|uniref:glycosyltransferase family 4 protein n=1 Tax=Bacillus sp. DNRA2 TaxID=2723053 RepID=UPI00145C7C6E|nr:glycosyltransferase family 1 protein [Bacillus sp. DNRA2]NMD69068.1 glycosyltransferase family 1 protein [Bacillus sp. DNRA2]